MRICFLSAGTVTGIEKVNIGIGQGLGLEIGHTSTANTADLISTTAEITVMTALGSMTGTTDTTGDQSDTDLSVGSLVAQDLAEASNWLLLPDHHTITAADILTIVDMSDLIGPLI